MDILYLLIPLSVILVFFILGGLWWAIYRGQFEDIEAEGERILKDTIEYSKCDSVNWSAMTHPDRVLSKGV